MASAYLALIITLDHFCILDQVSSQELAALGPVPTGGME